MTSLFRFDVLFPLPAPTKQKNSCKHTHTHTRGERTMTMIGSTSVTGTTIWAIWSSFSWIVCYKRVVNGNANTTFGRPDRYNHFEAVSSFVINKNCVGPVRSIRFIRHSDISKDEPDFGLLLFDFSFHFSFQVNTLRFIFVSRGYFVKQKKTTIKSTEQKTENKPTFCLSLFWRANNSGKRFGLKTTKKNQHTT